MNNFAAQIFENNMPLTDDTAVVDENGKRFTSWRELYEKSCAVAAYASAKGICGVVPVCMERSVEATEAFLGLVLAGIGIAPLSDSTPESRLELISEQTENAVFTKAQFDEAMSYVGKEIEIKEFADDDICYVVFTSGSTGTPKGVMHSNDSIVKALKRITGKDFLDCKKGEPVLEHANFSFVALILDMFAPLYGGCVDHILPKDACADGTLMTAYINEHNIKSTYITPKQLAFVGDMPSLKVVITGSERISNIGPNGYKLKNCWGMSETAGIAMSYDIKEPVEKTPIGVGNEYFRCYLLDEDGNPAQEGELCVSGAIAMGYYKRPDLTEQAFESNPFSNDEGHRVLMHTGDIVKRLPDGNLLYVNRKDFMIKINGQRVEPGEAENVISRIEGVTAVAVKGFTDDDGHSFLCAYYVADRKISEDEFIGFLNQFLPSYMVPAFYTRLEALPVNANGKLDRKALIAPDLMSLHSEYEEPVTEEEKALAEAFEQALACGRVGAQDDFFRLGGDSIRAMKVVSLVNIKGVDMASIVSLRTPRRIAQAAIEKSQIMKNKLETEEKSLKNIQSAPLTDSQLGIYLECAEVPESIKYNVTFKMSFDRSEKMTCEYVKNCVDSVISVHPALYSCIQQVGGEFVMMRCKMPQNGICMVEETDENTAQNKWGDFIRPFALDTAPLCRAEVILTKDKVHILFDAHHTVLDGSSVAVLIKELTETLAGKYPDEEKLDSFAVSEMLNKQYDESKESTDNYFAGMLGGVELDSNLLFDKKSDETNPKSEKVTLTIDGIDFAKIRKSGISESSFFMSVFGYTLAKMTGSTESLFAAAESGRKDAITENTVLMMVRTLPVYMKIDEKKNAFSLMCEVQENFYKTVENDSASFRELANTYGIKSDVMFVYQSDMLSGGETELGSVKVEMADTGYAISNFNAAVFREENAHRIVLDYRPDLYDRRTIERFAELFYATAKAFAINEAPENIKLIGSTDANLLDGFNNTDSLFDEKETIVEKFRKSARKNPKKTFIICQDRKYTYEQVDEITDNIAGYIASLKIGKGQTVSVLVSRSEFMFLSSMGIMKSGAMYQPLDPSYPADRLSFMRKDADSALIIADRALLPMLTDFDGKVLYTDEIMGLKKCDELPESPNCDDGFVLLYTSGTTGLPKGCMLKHSNLTAVIHSHTNLTEMNEDSIAASYASFGFDAHMLDFYPITACGGTLVIVSDDIRLELAMVRDYCEENKVSHMILTTQLAVQYATVYRKLKYLKCLLAGGEKMVSLEPPETYKLINGYGPTECTVYETQFTVDKYYDDIPIGTAISNTRVYVVDPLGRRVPMGVPGELVISGPQVAVCYINRPEQTAKAFVKNTFEENIPEKYSHCYKTGDIVRFLNNGQLVFIGRRDMQVKIRGFRIELSEVERVIRDFEGIKNVAVVATDAPGGGKCLNAYIVADEKIDIEKLNAYIASVKPPYMVPAATLQIDSIPLTVNGKVDKRKLPKIKIEFDDITKPETELQKKIYDLAVQATGISEFGINTDLFTAGLTSISSIHFCSLLANEFEIPVQLRTLKKNETIAKLEKFILKSKGILDECENSDDKNNGEEKSEITYGKSYPISKTMEGIFTECTAKPDSTFYNVPYLIKIADGIDENRLASALVSAVEAHPYMKAELFYDQEGNVCQHRRLEDKFTVNDIEIINSENIESLKADLVKPFAITNGRLFRLCVIKADGLYLFLDFHHIIADGTSMNIFITDVEKAYVGEKLTEEAYSGFDVAADEANARADKEELASSKEYYANLLEDLDRDFLPISDKYADDKPSSGKLITSQKNADGQAILDFCKKNRISPNALFVAAFGLTLCRYAGNDYSVFNTIYNGRNDTRANNTFAMLVKTLPVVFKTDKDDSSYKNCIEAVNDMAAQLTDSMINDIYSYGEIARSFGITNDIMFIYQGEGFSRNTFAGYQVKDVELSLSESKTPIAFQVMHKDGKLIYDLEYDGELYTEKLMQIFVDAYDMALVGLISNNNLSDVQLLSKETEAEMEKYNDTEFEYDKNRTISDMFLESCRTYPDKLCVAYKKNKLTYGKIEELTGRIAGFLIGKGIGKGSVVSILINRNENMVITAHGVLRTGAAYLGLDPTYPSDRLEFMIKDSGSSYLIAERSLMDRIPDYRGEVLYTDEIESLRIMTKEQEENFRKQDRFEITPENDALIIYSSGTTGVPKGSVLQHKAIVCFYHNYVRDCFIDKDANVATYASFGFDGGAMDVLSVPMAGAELYVIPDEIRFDIAALETFYNENEITSGFMTTQVGSMFMANTKCRSLKHFFVGGEKLIPVIPSDGIWFDNGYGPSETMCYVNKYKVKSTEKLQPIGKVSRNIKEYIIDKHGNRLPFGACGELCISGGQMGRGYLNRPEKTAQVFTLNPFSNKSGYEKMYHTGDIVRMLTDGNYDFVGRNDGQVKIRGFRVELGEVEGQIRKFKGVESAVVTALDNPSGGKYLAAYVVAEGKLSIDELKVSIAKEKPDYMVPTAIMQIDEIPITSNGKVDKRKLPKIEVISTRKGAEPADETEEKICRIFAEVLGLEKVYADDDFFKIGDSSISAIRVTVKCEQEGFSVVYKNLFANPTPQLLAGFVMGEKQEDIEASQLENSGDHNYSAIEYNICDNLKAISNNGVGDVLLTGATGFLGSHILRELIDNTDGSVYCIVRNKEGLTADFHLKMMMVYYFEDWYGDKQSARVTVIDGDIEDEATRKKLSDISFDTIINCAANVKHFAAGDELTSVNVTGVENLIKIAEEKNAKLIQISTISVAGESVNGSVSADYLFKETDLNIGQSLENKYIYTKYLAEQSVIDAISNKRIRGKIIRLGNLMARAEDSEFQVNAGTNGFLRMFIAFAELGCFPINKMDETVEFSPIDAVARAVVLLSGTPDEFTVFHARNCNTIHYGYFINAISDVIKHIDIVEPEEFAQRLAKEFEGGKDGKNSEKVEKLGGLLAYNTRTNENISNKDDAIKQKVSDYNERVAIRNDATFTARALYRLGFAWPLVSTEYLDKMVEALSEMNFFTDD